MVQRELKKVGYLERLDYITFFFFLKEIVFLVFVFFFFKKSFFGFCFLLGSLGVCFLFK